MSDHPNELQFKLNNIVLAVSDVVEWFDLGLQLGLPITTLRLIAADPNIKDIKSQRLAMLSEWFKYDTAATWEKLAAALVAIGERVAATNISSKYTVKVAPGPGPVVDASNQDDKTCQEMTQTVFQKIKSQFASLQVEVRSAMETRQVKLKDVHQFLVSFFQGECCIPEAPDLTKLFNIVTNSGLWRYDHYGPLEELAEKFLPENNLARKLVSEYKDQLSGFYTVMKIIDFIDLSDLDDSEDDSDSDSEDDTQHSLSPKESKKLYRKLKVTLKLDRKTKLSDMTMSYVDTLWKSLIEKFNLPPLTAIIKKIVGGSLIITWLVPPQVSTVIAASYSKALEFYQQHNIVQVQLDGHTLYDEEWIADDSNLTLIKACQLRYVEATTVLLDHGANVNQTESKYGNTALIEACLLGYVEIARALLEHRASVDKQNYKGETALIWACYYVELEIVGLLLKAGARTDIQEESGRTALYWAAYRGSVNIVQMLIDHGATVDLGRDVHCGSTGLMLASGGGNIETVRVLLEANADPNIVDEYGDTALHWAASKGSLKIVNILVEYGAAVDIRNKYGQAALEVGSGGGHGTESMCKHGPTALEVDRGCDDDTALEVDGDDTALEVDRGGDDDTALEVDGDDTALEVDRGGDDDTALEVDRGGGDDTVLEMYRGGDKDAVLEVDRGGDDEAVREELKQHITQAMCEVLGQEQLRELHMTEITEEQRESLKYWQRFTKKFERMFLKERTRKQVKKREKYQKKEHHFSRVRGGRERRSLWNRLMGHRDRPGQIIGTAPAPEK